jgi:hypothetical protein
MGPSPVVVFSLAWDDPCEGFATLKRNGEPAHWEAVRHAVRRYTPLYTWLLEQAHGRGVRLDLMGLDWADGDAAFITYR